MFLAGNVKDNMKIRGFTLIISLIAFIFFAFWRLSPAFASDVVQFCYDQFSPSPSASPSESPSPSPDESPSPSPSPNVNPSPSPEVSPSPEPSESPSPSPSPSPSESPNPCIQFEKEFPEPCESPSPSPEPSTPPAEEHHDTPSAPGTPECTSPAVTMVGANFHVYRNGDQAIAKWVPTQGDKATIYYKQVGAPDWQYSLANVDNNGYQVINGLGSLDITFALQQANGCAGGPLTNQIVDGASNDWILFR